MKIAKFETPHFSFLAAGNTEAEALAVLYEAWEKHSGQRNADPGYLKEFECDVSYEELLPGMCLRDFQPFHVSDSCTDVYVIVAEDTDITGEEVTQMFWSNAFGWSDLLSDATRFTLSDRELVNLPMGGAWKLIEK